VMKLQRDKVGNHLLLISESEHAFGNAIRKFY